MKTFLATSVVSVGMMVASASGAITGVTGQTTWLGSPPVSCTLGSLTGFTAYAWDEQQATLFTNLFVDDTQNPGNNSTPLPGVINGPMDSHFLHFEPLPGAVGVSGTVSFSSQIVGVMFVNNTLDMSDASCGAFGTVYPTLYPLRGLNSASMISYSGNVLTFNLWAAQPTADLGQVRVLTRVPAPGAAALLGLGALVVGRRRR